jgi:hypothetical protein
MEYCSKQHKVKFPPFLDANPSTEVKKVSQIFLIDVSKKEIAAPHPVLIPTFTYTLYLHIISYLLFLYTDNV